MYQPNRAFDPYNLDTMLALSPRSNQYPMSQTDRIAGGYGNIGNPDKIIMMLAKSLADLQGTAIDTETPETVSNQQTKRGTITNEDLKKFGSSEPGINDGRYDWYFDGARYYYKPKGSKTNWTIHSGRK